MMFPFLTQSIVDAGISNYDNGCQFHFPTERKPVNHGLDIPEDCHYFLSPTFSTGASIICVSVASLFLPN
jgi:hypothetical protein